MSFWLIFLSAAVLALLLTGWLRSYALARRLMDIPNERSSHTVPTPRGGGVAIVLTFLVILPLLGLISELPAASFRALLGAGGGVAVGRLDGVLGVVMAYLPLIWLAVRFNAEARELQEVV